MRGNMTSDDARRVVSKPDHRREFEGVPGGDDVGGVTGEWGEKVEWDAKNLHVTNLPNLKTPRVADLIKPVYADGYRLD